MNTHLHTCPCGNVTVAFDEEAAKNLPAAVVRKRWPRGNCSKWGRRSAADGPPPFFRGGWGAGGGGRGGAGRRAHVIQ